MSVTRSPTLLAIEAAVPPLAITQEELYETFFRKFYEDVPGAEAIFKSSGVRKRHLSWDPRLISFEDGGPLTGDRMTYWERSALELSCRTVGAVVARVDKSRIGSFVVASCTGYTGPTLDLPLAKAFHLSPGIRRTFVGHMGCNAAFNVIKLALDSVAARPEELALVTCTEACSLHIRRESTKEQVVTHALFGDASATLVIGNAEPSTGPQFVRTHTHVAYETMDAMTWSVMNDGFSMTLSPLVPFILAEVIEVFVSDLLRPARLTHRDVAYWAIHPGGPKILDVVGAKLGLTEAHLRPSRHVLAEYGNCSSATVLLILKEILDHERPKPGDYGVLVAFGPGLTLESLLVRF